MKAGKGSRGTKKQQVAFGRKPGCLAAEQNAWRRGSFLWEGRTRGWRWGGIWGPQLGPLSRGEGSREKDEGGSRELLFTSATGTAASAAC